MRAAEKAQSRQTKLILRLSAALFLALCILICIFRLFVGQYKSGSAYENANHLIEINHQVRAYIEEVFESDRNVARSVAAGIESARPGSEAGLFGFLKTQKSIWGADGIYVYSSGGLCLDESAAVQNRDSASSYAYETVQRGESFHIADSTIEYSLAAKTRLLLRGRPVIAVSVVRNLDTLFENLGIHSFNDSGCLYLTRQNGVKISKSSGRKTAEVFNVLALFENRSMRNLSLPGMELRTAMAEAREAVFLCSGGGEPGCYVVASPVRAMNEICYLFYIVPESAVNLNMNHFTAQATRLIFIIALMFFAAFFGFFWLYNRRSRKYAAAIREREEFFNLLVSETNTVFLFLSPKQRRPLYVSSNEYKMLGANPPALVFSAEGRPEILPPRGAEAGSAVQNLNRALAEWDGESDFVSDYFPYETGGILKYLVLRLYPVREPEKQFVGMVLDATKERQRTEDMRRALVLADSANHAKTRFLSNMSHDIRTPLNAIINMTRFAMADYNSREKTMEHLDVIMASSEHLLKLINDILDMSRIESGKLSFATEPFDIKTALREVCEMIEPLCESRGHSFAYTDQNVRHTKLRGDKLRLNQILINLLNNAVKYTPDNGRISLRLTELTSLKSGTATFRFEVEDNGIGISPEAQKTVFEPFSRGDEEHLHSTEGTGLGLSITKNLVEAMSGTISLRSTPAVGSVFTVELFFPVDSGSAQEPAEEADENEWSQLRFDGKRALLAEDNPINREIAGIMLKNLGFAVDFAEDGEEAAARYAESGAPYDIIYMDIQMPKADGYEAARRIRASGRAGAGTVPIVAMTANVFAEDIEKARQAGMNAHVGKPIDPAELRRETGKLLGAGTGKKG